MSRPLLKSISKLALVGLAALAASGAGHAETAANVAAQWGLLGSWRIDCTAPPSVDNFNETYVVRGGKLYLDRVDSGGAGSEPVLAAKIRPDNSIAIFIRFESAAQTRENDVIRDGDRKRVMSNSRINSQDYSVRNGVLVASGKPTPWMNHCE